MVRHRNSGLPVSALVVVIAAAGLAVAGCGSSSSSAANATSLLQQTFGGSHSANSGNLSLSVTVTPSGSGTLTQPTSLTFAGPFQSRGKGNLPASNFNITISGQRRRASIAVLSTGTAGYVTLQGHSYELPQPTFARLEASFGSLAMDGNAGSGSGALSTLGIDPMRWLVHPEVVGTENVAGIATTRIHAAINVPALLNDLNSFLQKAASAGGSGTRAVPSGISPTTRSQIAGSARNSSLDVWTGKADKTVRMLVANITLRKPGPSALGGAESTTVGVVMQYANLNQPQTIAAPQSIRPYSEFAAKAPPILQQFASAAVLKGT